MESIMTKYQKFEAKILENLESSGIVPRLKRSSGLWLAPLIGISGISTLLKEDISYSEICLLVGITGFGLIISSICLILQLSIEKTEKISSKDFQLIYFLPASLTSMLYLVWANKGLLVSVSWGLGIGTMGTWGVLQLMSLLPKCFTLGEAITVTHGVILFILSAVTNIPQRYHLPPLHDDDIITIILQVVLLFIGAICFLCKFVPQIRSSKLFYIVFFGLLFTTAVPLLHILLDQSPLLWILSYAFGNIKRICLILYWGTCMLAATGVLIYQIISNSRATTVGRKIFHLFAVLVYIPGLIFEPTLLYLASGVILAVFLLLELMRFFKLPPMSDALEVGFSMFVDEKDSLVSLSPLYLHIGLSFPLWMPNSNPHLLPLLSGVMAIGIGDSAASFIGYKYGRNKWPGSRKTIEGTIACMLSQIIFILGLSLFGYVYNWWTLLKSILVVIGISLIEAQTDQIDNLALPLLSYIFFI